MELRANLPSALEDERLWTASVSLERVASSREILLLKSHIAALELSNAALTERVIQLQEEAGFADLNEQDGQGILVSEEETKPYCDISIEYSGRLSELAVDF